ncbi:MAG: Eco57I restriction-modification methylase domain-containing protein [Verrucomicrobiota bacterium]
MVLLEQFERLRIEAYGAMGADRGSLGQYYTPQPIASLLASMLPKPSVDTVHLLDPGAGVGMLSAAAVAELRATGVREIQLTCCEVDSAVVPYLRVGMKMLVDWCKARGVILQVEIIEADFILWAMDHLGESDFFSAPPRRFDGVVMNPPYKKIGSSSLHRRCLKRAGLECTNLYAAFLFLGAKLLRPGGQLVSINPRSFANGPYFRDFRKKFFALAPLHAVHVFNRRDLAFANDKVLQENVVLHAVRGVQSETIRIISSVAGGPAARVHDVPAHRAIEPDDADCVLHLETDAGDSEVANLIRALPARLADLGLEVSTGRVVDFRVREALSFLKKRDAVPLIYPQHLRNAGVVWPKQAKKPDYFCPGDQHAAALIPAGTYVVTKRFTSKEEKRRIAASLLTIESVPAEQYALENHLNYFHAVGAPMDDDLARGLVAYLNSTLADQYFRLYNGHTQVNATDLRAMPYPPATALRKLGRKLAGLPLTTEHVDPFITQLCRANAEGQGKGSSVHSGRTRRSSRAA